MIVLSKEQVLKLHANLIKATGGSDGIRDEGMLDMALNNPFQSFDGKELYPSIQAKAARLCFGLVKNHAMLDGNKRLGTHVMLVFLALNGYELYYSQKELSDVILALALKIIKLQSRFGGTYMLYYETTMIYTVKIEQTYHEPKRMKYIAQTDSFVEKNVKSLSYERNVRQPYGWIKESGTPPCEHLDVYVMTDKDYRLGDEVKVKIIGIFKRNDGDHKLVGVLEDREIEDFSELTETEKEDMHRLYPKEDPGEGWFGRQCAEEVIREFFGKKKRKTIIMVQHTQSQHHVNGMIGAWGDWELTQIGKSQAYEVGKWLLREGCDKGFAMYVSDLKRALQTAQEINKTLRLQYVVADVIREVNAGRGNGQSREWYDANKRPKKNGYYPDYKPFEDAESDYDLWSRLYPFYQQIVSNHEEKILIISHGTTLSFLQSMLMGDSLRDIARRRFNGPSGSVSKVVLEPDGRTVAQYINQRVC